MDILIIIILLILLTAFSSGLLIAKRGIMIGAKWKKSQITKEYWDERIYNIFK